MPSHIYYFCIIDNDWYGVSGYLRRGSQPLCARTRGNTWGFQATEESLRKGRCASRGWSGLVQRSVAKKQHCWSCLPPCLRWGLACCSFCHGNWPMSFWRSSRLRLASQERWDYRCTLQILRSQLRVWHLHDEHIIPVPSALRTSFVFKYIY